MKFARYTKGNSAYFTKGHLYPVLRYPVLRYEEGGFILMNDNGDEAFCIPHGCAHICGGDWEMEIIEDD